MGLKMGYTSRYTHYKNPEKIGETIMLTNGFRGTIFSDKPIYEVVDVEMCRRCCWWRRQPDDYDYDYDYNYDADYDYYY